MKRILVKYREDCICGGRKLISASQKLIYNSIVELGRMPHLFGIKTMKTLIQFNAAQNCFSDNLRPFLTPVLFTPAFIFNTGLRKNI